MTEDLVAQTQLVFSLIEKFDENTTRFSSTSGVEERTRLCDANTQFAKQIASQLATLASAHPITGKNLHNYLRRKFLDCWTRMRDKIENIESKSRRDIARQFRIVDPNITDAEISHLVELGETRAFSRQMLKSQQDAVSDAVLYVDKKHTDIVKLEKSIQELHSLFQDMALLTDEQDLVVDQIEHNVIHAQKNTVKAVTQLRDANEQQRRGRRKTCVLACVIVLIVLATIGGSLAAGFTRSRIN